MRNLLLGLTAGLALVPFNVFAADPTPTAQPVAMTQQDNPVVCHYYYYEGQVLKQQVCQTQHAWDRLRLTQQRFLMEFQLRALDQHK
ncbi:MAG TPA: hypothetical protein VGK90_04225 [Rhizomicrobium sp.]